MRPAAHASKQPAPCSLRLCILQASAFAGAPLALPRARLAAAQAWRRGGAAMHLDFCMARACAAGAPAAAPAAGPEEGAEKRPRRASEDAALPGNLVAYVKAFTDSFAPR